LCKQFTPCEIALQRALSSVPYQTKQFVCEKPSRVLQRAARGCSESYPFANALDSLGHSPLILPNEGNFENTDWCPVSRSKAICQRPLRSEQI
jgi:hypothetical protein